ncbi:aldo/keto reductase [Lichenibacterium dinghuense]|uniref:aldo/keto reductase n=1 Tax=Lichenibacterium dinghuense TaxID=2895977 RepID=UPI001F181249|nr:aldo/keto reductase [Lichenibacterium sp. 6Y81]
MADAAQRRDAVRASDLRSVGRVRLPALGLGCAQLGGLFQAMDLAEGFDLLSAAWRAGIRYFDTAPYYGYTRSERRVGCFLSERDRASFTVSTKVGRLMAPATSVGSEEFGYVAPLPFPPNYAYGYDDVLRSFEHSQQRLGLAHIDLLYVHDIGRLTHGERHDLHWDALTRGGGFRALRRLRDEGAIGGIGLGVNEAAVVSDAMSETHLDAVLLAGRHTLLEQDALPLLDACARSGTAVVAAGPFNSGILAGGTTFDYAAAPPAVTERARALGAVADLFGVPLAAAALQFPLAHPAVVSVVAGAHSADQVAANVAAFERPIPAAFWAALRYGGLVAPATPLPAGA